MTWYGKYIIYISTYKKFHGDILSFGVAVYKVLGKGENQKRNARCVFQSSLHNILTIDFIQSTDIRLQSIEQWLQNEPI